MLDRTIKIENGKVVTIFTTTNEVPLTDFVENKQKELQEAIEKANSIINELQTLVTE